MGHFVPHTGEEVAAMLDFLGLAGTEELFEAVPAALRLAAGPDGRHLDLPEGMSEFDTLAEVQRLADRNHRLVCFAGAGAYDHDVAAATRSLAMRSEFVTAYTPYQAEVSQGVLQLLFEYQTMVARLAGLPVANASLYDGASACVEAANLAVAATGRRALWVSQGLHPRWRGTLRTMAAGPGHRVVELPLAEGTTAFDPGAAGGRAGPPAAVVVQYPNHLGCLEDVAAAARAARAAGALLVVAFDPVAAGVLRTPGDFGADVAVGEGQPFGTPLSFGGPFLGLFACRSEHVRRLPGRLVGETVDTEGRRAYVTTLRAREQDIRREKASSNVCTNQTLVAVFCAIQLAWLGTAGLRELALRCARGTRYARQAVMAIDGVEPVTARPVLREFAVRTPLDAHTVIERMAEEGFLAGVALEPEYGGGLLVAVTEKRTRDEIDRYAATLEKVIR